MDVVTDQTAAAGGAARPADEDGPATSSTEQRRGRVTDRQGLAVALLVLAYFLVRATAWIAGVRYDDSVLDGTRATDVWQLLDVRLLQGDLIDSIWHLNSQPPLFNLYVGFILHMPAGLRTPIELAFALTLGVAMVVCAYLLLVELTVPRSVAFGVTLVCVVASPAYLLYEHWLNYAYPTAAFGTIGAWCLVRYLRSGRARFGLGFFTAYAAVVLLSSSYQIEWLGVGVLIVVIAQRQHWRQVLAVAAVPVVVVVGWYAKDYAQVGTTTTSSWLGMNLARSVLYRAPAGQVADLQHQGRLDALASIPPFSDPQVYSPRFVHAQPSSVAAIGALTKADGATNFNNPLYATIANRYLHDDLVWIQAHPRAYVNDVSGSVAVWMVATDQNFTSSVNWPAVRNYAWLYDKAVEWQPVQDPAPGFVVFARGWHRPAWLSFQAIAVYLVALVGTPILAWRRRRSDPALAGTLVVLWWTTGYAMATSTLVEIGENERFRSELGPVPLILAVVIATAVVRWVWQRRARDEDALHSI